MRDLDEQHAYVTGEPAAPKGCTAGSGRRPLEKDPHSGNLASGLPVLVHGVPPGRGFKIELTCGETLRIEVHDSGGGQVRRDAEPVPEAEGGRGLLLVAALADAWGVGERDPGKTVWCEFAVSASKFVGSGPRAHSLP